MASTTSEQGRQCVVENGFWALENPIIGELVDEIVKGGFRFKTEEGLDLCRFALEEPLIRGVIESFFPRSELAFFKAYGQTRFNHSIINKTPELRILVVQLWSSASEAIVYSGSHLQSLGATNAPNGLLMIPDDHLRRPNITPTAEVMPQGGLAILDGRSAFKILRGKIIMLGFMIPDESKYWAKMRLPTHALMDKVRSMQTDTIGLNFKLQESEPDTDER
ncbi:hypothetical protein H634G_05963 [Metarhizium anisopliae BRIP 53293]|uniref:Uncharacterized protein n=1 Tax=Metarhizium anisopliae BRIP 53293 TaxID=1291518 RepID=A0A0D9NXN9_METAN|nr:hypothetical protein H634G_05963 [Metarhizium anisopliae BRIP 53293]KJK85196.1 hypothetical protein H633G_10972 [Metarhizium anisopliae BRIP 53284]